MHFAWLAVLAVLLASPLASNVAHAEDEPADDEASTN